jgi:signal transduction histidine kinase
MKDADKVKEQLINELQEMRQKAVTLEAEVSERKQTGEALQQAYDELEQRAIEDAADLSRVNEQLKRELAERKPLEADLRQSEETERHFKESLKTLHEVCNVLSKVDTFDDLCRCAVELARSRLGFDRLGLWFVDEEPSFVVGTFGVDEDGQIRDERAQRMSIHTSAVVEQILTQKEGWILQSNVSLYNDRSEIVGRGDLASTAIWDGEGVIGCISIDNLLLGRQITEAECELLTLYASTLGHLCSRVRAEEELSKHRAHLEVLIRERTGELEAAQKELLDGERLATIGRISASIAHDLRNPLGTIGNAVFYLKRKVPKSKPKWREYLDIIDQAILAANSIISNLLDLTRIGKPEKQAVDLCSLLQDVFVHANVPEGVRWRFAPDSPPFILVGDQAKLRQVFENLVLNALEAIDGSGEIVVTALRSAEYDIITFEDDGPGIAPEHRASVFEPLFSTKPKGIGLGLWICRRLVELQGGTIVLEDEKSKDAAFKIQFPRQHEA